MAFKFEVVVRQLVHVQEAQNLDEARGMIKGQLQATMPQWEVVEIQFMGKANNNPVPAPVPKK